MLMRVEHMLMGGRAYVDGAIGIQREKLLSHADAR